MSQEVIESDIGSTAEAIVEDHVAEALGAGSGTRGRRDESIATDDVERPVTRSLVEASTERLSARHRRTAGLNVEVGVPQAVITTLEGAGVEDQVAHLACS